jgi:hypothetical protein
MSKFINISVPGGAGGTFLDWSINYLTSANLTKEYIDSASQLIVLDFPIPHSPLNANDAHRHKKTHPTGYNAFANIWEMYQQNKWTDDIFSVYSVDDMQDEFYLNNIINNFPNIYKHILFKFEKKHIDIMFGLQYERVPTVKEKIRRDVVDDQKWVVREKLALYYPKMIKEQLSTNIKVSTSLSNVHIIDFSVYIDNFFNALIHMLQILEINVIESRIVNWHKIYNQWLLMNDIKFYANLDNIVSDIIHNNKHDMSIYNMTFGKEIIISKKLLFEYNLSLMADGINQMPLNTHDWHNLLEENIYHDLIS